MHAVIDVISGTTEAIWPTLERAGRVAVGEQHVVRQDRGAEALVAHVPPLPGMGGWVRAREEVARRWAQDHADEVIREIILENRQGLVQQGRLG